jgi:hypothetical protein
MMTMHKFKKDEHLDLPWGDALDALVAEFLPQGRSKLTLAERRRLLKELLILARSEAGALAAARNRESEAQQRADSADERVAQAKREADDKVTAAERARDAVIARFDELARQDRTIMILIAQLTRASGLVPRDLKLTHEEGRPALATYKLGDQPVDLTGLAEVDVNSGGHRCLATTDGMTLPQGDAALAYFLAVQALGTKEPDWLAKQIEAIVEADMLTGLMAATGCGRCEACLTLAAELTMAEGDSPSVIAALAKKAATPCPPENLRSRDDRVRLEVHVRPQARR